MNVRAVDNQVCTQFRHRIALCIDKRIIVACRQGCNNLVCTVIRSAGKCIAAARIRNQCANLCGERVTVNSQVELGRCFLNSRIADMNHIRHINGKQLFGKYNLCLAVCRVGRIKLHVYTVGKRSSNQMTIRIDIAVSLRISNYKLIRIVTCVIAVDLNRVCCFIAPYKRIAIGSPVHAYNFNLFNGHFNRYGRRIVILIRTGQCDLYVGNQIIVRLCYTVYGNRGSRCRNRNVIATDNLIGSESRQRYRQIRVSGNARLVSYFCFRKGFPKQKLGTDFRGNGKRLRRHIFSGVRAFQHKRDLDVCSVIDIFVVERRIHLHRNIISGSKAEIHIRFHRKCHIGGSVVRLVVLAGICVILQTAQIQIGNSDLGARILRRRHNRESADQHCKHQNDSRNRRKSEVSCFCFRTLIFH